MKRFYQVAIVVTSTALGIALGWGLIALFSTPLAQHFSDGPFTFLIYLGFIGGIMMTLSVQGGLVAGVALARRVGRPAPLLETAAV
jgi:hypothetical protein